MEFSIFCVKTVELVKYNFSKAVTLTKLKFDSRPKQLTSSFYLGRKQKHFFLKKIIMNLYSLNTSSHSNIFYKNNFMFPLGSLLPNLFDKSKLHLTKDVYTQFVRGKKTFYNNFFPLFFKISSNLNRLFIKNTVMRTPYFNMYYTIYLLYFLEKLVKTKVWIKLNTTIQVPTKLHNTFFNLFYKNRRQQKALGKHFYLLECYEVLFLSLLNRDLKFFALWFKKIMEKVHLKKHKKFCRTIESILRTYKFFLNSTSVKGFSLDIRGKLGTTGNSKKKHYFFVVGDLGFTKKNHGLTFYQTTVRTHTGVLGVTLFLSY